MLLGDRDAGQLQAPPQDSAESVFSDPAELAASGYTMQNKTFNPHYLHCALRAIGVTEEELDGESSKRATQYLYESEETPLEIMSPYFVVAALPLSGILIAISNYSPMAVATLEELAPESLPPGFPRLRHWSDIAFLHWQSITLQETHSTQLNHIIRSSIQNHQTLSIVNKVLERNNVETLPEWPGITFDINTEQAHALLGTPNGSGIAFLLFQHKQQLGHKTVEKVTMFYENNPSDLHRWPSLLFHLKDVCPLASED
ncbi:hypothetical protein K491DRAFT_611948 [Lophiostoma macrostomum CBS 122681]|uniref:Uncharacterized protein n=1 Tax=Lophiostoma macrostomum CBS 122681 TaxID=1314788 RepID=A0A6A6SLX4_9PLEO|nr:hypothetical protein K491DRAFT_611948 [Lophiostoma macrostomum CBS 122681]